MKKAKFAMAFHCYQPVFNFEQEFERAYENAYRPLLKTMDEFPGIKATFHFSGNMLEWFEKNAPEYIEKLKKLIKRGQIELIGGGCFEPVMTIIPEKDRIDQLNMNQRIIERIFDIKAKGAWLAERVWAPELVNTLRSSGIEYTIVDDHHVIQAGIPEEDVYRPFVTSSNGSSVTLFPSLTFLRYSMPFKFPEVTVKYMKDIYDKKSGDDVCFFFADDGEKFGQWPFTYNWVYRKGWLRNFFSLLEENLSWLDTLTYSEIKDSTTSSKIGNIPESSYKEMIEWSRGNFSNFLMRYPEAGRMHKRMLSVSDSIRSFGEVNQREHVLSAKRELFKAQSGCAYWHGAFGGLYLPHLRSGVYRHLIKAQKILDEMGGISGNTDTMRIVESESKDGASEVILDNKYMNVFIEPDVGGSIGEIDYKAAEINLVNTMTRVRENYHDKLNKTFYDKMKFIQKLIYNRSLSIHDLLGVGEKGLRPFLDYDEYQRKSFLTHIFKDVRPLKTRERNKNSNSGFLREKYSFNTGIPGEDFIFAGLKRRDKIYMDAGESCDVEVIKKTRLSKDSVVIFSQETKKCSSGKIDLQYAVEFNFMIWDKDIINKPRSLKTDKFSIKDEYEGVSLDFYMDKDFDVFMHPVFTVNETESGLRKTFQGVSIMIGDTFKGSAGEEFRKMEMKLAIG